MVDLFRLAEKLKIDDIAVCHAGRFPNVEELLLKDMELGIYPPFVERDIEKRINPTATLPNAASFIVILQHYDPPVYKKREGFYGNIAPSACGEDYHRIVKNKLNDLLRELEIADPDGLRLAYVDNSPFSEKHVAARSGLGKIMKNGLFYSRRFGSRCFIGLILTNRTPEFYGLSSREDYSDSWFDRCGSCMACLRSCPGQAISSQGMNSYKCISYLTQTREKLTAAEEKSMGIQIYGCDICQKVCPLNPRIPVNYETGIEIPLNEILNMTNKEFKTKFQRTAAGWRGKKQLQRNAEIVLKNIMEK